VAIISICAVVVVALLTVALVWYRHRRANPRLASAAPADADHERRNFLPRLAAVLVGLWALKPKSGSASPIQPLADEDFDLDLRLSSSKAQVMQAQSRTDCCKVSTYSPTCAVTCPASCHGSCGASCTPTCHNTCPHSCVGTCGGASCAPTCTQACRIRQTLNCPVPPPGR